MKVEITFGRSLDGTAGQGSDALGELRVGPKGLLGFLELHTGLYCEPIAPIERLSAFLGVLNESPKAIPSFAASFSIDPLATARRLLDWIDALRLHGWDGSLPDTAPARLRELAMVADRAKGRVAPSEGERLTAIRNALRNGARLPLSSLTICEELVTYPLGWRRVLELLPHQDLTFESRASSSSDLGRLQRALGGATGETFSGDGSVRIFRASTDLGAARFLASGRAGGGEDAVVIVGGCGSLWDEACLSQGIPRPASYGGSPCRPALQVLPLAMALHRDPINLEALLAFLTHPICPIGYERRYFAEALVADGGLGGPNWERARERALESYTRYGKDQQRLDELLAEWLPARRDGGVAFSREMLRTIARRTKGYLSARGRALEDSTGEGVALEGAIAQCGLFERTLDLLGESFKSVPVKLVDELLAAATHSSGARPEGERELGSGAWVADPGAITNPVGKLIWLSPVRPEGPDPWPWSAKEIAALSSCGVELPALSGLNARITRDWMRAVCLATESLALILPPQGREAHPLSLLISSIRPGIVEEIEAATLTGKGSSLTPVPLIQLPKPKRWWKISRSVSPDTGWRSSYSQMDKLLRRPAQWVLERKARIRTSDILSIPDRDTLAGTFAHALMERCIKTFGARAATLTGEEFESWFTATFEALLTSQGARWLEPGAGQERLRLRESLHRSIQSLLSQIRAANAVDLESERELRGVLFGTPFMGKADIVLKTAGNQHAIIDMKNSTWLSGFRDMLESDTDIQLTIYAELYRQSSGTRAEAAYYLIPRERLLARKPSIFTLAELLGGATTPTRRLNMIQTNYTWRQHQLEEGRIEVVCEATEESEEKAPGPEGGLPLQEAFDRYDPFLGIYGWGDSE